MSLNPVKVGSGAATLTPTPGADATQNTEATPQTSGAAAFFKGIGKKMASAAKAIGQGISNLAPKHKPTAESLSPGSKAAFSNLRVLLKERDKLEKVDNPTPAQQTRLDELKDEVKTARREVVKHMKEQLKNGPLYAAAQNEANKHILDNPPGKFYSSDPASTVFQAMHDICLDPKRIEEIVKKGMKTEEAVSIFLYTQGAFAGINRELRGGAPGDFIQQVTKNVNSGLARLPPYEEPVYRVVNLPASVDNQYQVGATVSDRGMLSTTCNPDFDVWGGGNSHVISIVGQGDSAGRDVSWLSESPGEKEVLFPPGTEFVVKQRDQAATPQVIGKQANGEDQFDSQVGLLLVQKPKK